MLVSLFVALFLPDMFSLAQVPSNIEQDAILTAVFVFFSFEFIVLSITDTSYLFGFFFFMDMVGTLSMLADISFMGGPDATQPDVIDNTGPGGTNDVMVVRAARAAKLGARAGRLSRVLKVLRFLLPFLGGKDEDTDRVKMARVISRQLTHALSTRVAFLTITVVVTMPAFSIFLFPENDFSMASWTQLLDLTANEYHATYLQVQAGQPYQAELEAQRLFFTSELDRFSKFYGEQSYGPFEICVGEISGGKFNCKPEVLGEYRVIFNSSFEPPVRKSSIRQISGDRIQARFSLAAPNQVSSGLATGLMIFVIVVMVSFGLLMSSSISEIALKPLERMLDTVRETCKHIFKYTSGLQDDEQEDENEGDYDDCDQDSEFDLLDQAVKKIGDIVLLSMTNIEPVANTNMTEDEKMALGWTQGDAAVTKKTEPEERMPTPKEERRQSGGSLAMTTQKALSSEMVEELKLMSWDATNLTPEQHVPVCMYIVCNSEGSRDWVKKNAMESQLVKFMTTCESKYVPNPFHSFSHGLDCMWSIARFSRLSDARHFFSEQILFWLLIAGIGHDLGHPGVNNEYLVETGHELAVKYNDRSPLEMMHCSTLFQILADPEANVFAQVDKNTYKEIRKGMISAVLHTDMIQHFAMITDLKLIFEMNSDENGVFKTNQAMTDNPTNVQHIANGMVHTADVNNAMKPWKVAEKLAYLCLEEFFAQGDKEKAGDLRVGFLNDRLKVSKPNSQIGFIDFLLVPLAESLAICFPPLDYLVGNLGDNIGKWATMWMEDAKPEQELLDKTKARVSNVQARCQACVRDQGPDGARQTQAGAVHKAAG
jgi:hypothetical protein